jgi:uncharacterized membrane protein YidH (DUF202 family)
MTGATLAGIGFILFGGGGSAWAGVVLSRSYRKVMPNDATFIRWSRTEAGLCLGGFASMGLAFICIGVLTWRYGKGSEVTVPVHAPLIDQLLPFLPFLMLILIFTGFGLFLALTAMHRTRDEQFREGR